MSSRGSKHLNAVKHGAFAKTTILPGEDPAEFEELHFSLIEEWKPVGPTEEDAVLSIAQGVWRKRRAQKFLQAQIANRRFDPNERLYDEAERLKRFLRVIDTAPFVPMVDIAPEFFKPLYDNLVSTVLSADQAKYLQEKCPREHFKSGSEWLQGLRNEITGLLLAHASLGQVPEAVLGRAAEFFTPEVVEQELAVDERVDAMIDRAIKRLVQTKAIKQMLDHPSPHGKDPNGKDRQQRKARPSGKPNGPTKLPTTKAFSGG
jgi:hypothetical protein